MCMPTPSLPQTKVTKGMLVVNENLADRMVLAESCVKVKAPGGSTWRCVARASVSGVL